MANFTLPQSPTYSQPETDISEAEKTKEWWINSIRYFTSFYDRKPHTYNESDYMEGLSPIQKAIQMSLYYTGKQRNINWNHITTDSDGTTLPAVWINDKTVKKLIDHLAGMLNNQLENKDISSRSLSERATTEKMNV